MNQVNELDPHHLRKVIGQNIRLRRRELKLTQREVGDALGYDRRWVSHIERGESSCTANYLPRLLAVLKLPSFDVLLREVDSD